VWPIEEPFTQEGILGMLIENDYNCEKVLNLISTKDKSAICKIKEINLRNKLELQQITAKSKNYTLRNNKINPMNI